MPNAAIQLRTYNGQWVCAEGGGGQQLVANRGIPSTWETFAVIPIQGGPLQDGSLVALQAFNGQYVCAEKGGGSIVVANRSAQREWETFTLRRDAGAGELQNGDKIGLQAFNGQYVCAEGGGGRQVVANRNGRYQWETFTITKLAPRHVHIELDTVFCEDTEDYTGADEFFAIGAGVDRFSGKSDTLLSKPFSINNGQTKDFPAEATQRVLFDGDVDAASTIVLGVMFYDEDSNHDWANYGPMITSLADGVSSGLSQLGPWGIAGGVALTVASRVAGIVMTLDEDDLLGHTSLELPVLWQPIGTNIRPIGARGGSGWYSSWKYLINMKVTAN